MEKLLSVKELAQLIGLSPSTLYGLVERRQIPVQRVRRRIMFVPSKIEGWLAQQTQACLPVLAPDADGGPANRRGRVSTVARHRLAPGTRDDG